MTTVVPESIASRHSAQDNLLHPFIRWLDLLSLARFTYALTGSDA